MSWRDFINSTPIDIIDNIDKMPLSEIKNAHIVDIVDFVDRDQNFKSDPLHPSWQIHIIRVLKEVWPGQASLSYIAGELHVDENRLKPLIKRLLNDRIIIQEREGYRVKDYTRGDTGHRLLRFEDLIEGQQERVSIMRFDGGIPEHEALKPWSINKKGQLND